MSKKFSFILVMWMVFFCWLFALFRFEQGYQKEWLSQATKRPIYQIDCTIPPEDGLFFNNYNSKGWGGVELNGTGKPTFRWTHAPSVYSDFNFILNDDARYILLQLNILMTNGYQHIQTYLNDTLIDEVKLLGTHTRNIIFSADLLRQQELHTLRFELPDSHKPSNSSEHRMLGIALRSLSLMNPDNLTPCNFDASVPYDTDDKIHFGLGWSSPENGFRWTASKTSHIYLVLPPPAHDFIGLVLDTAWVNGNQFVEYIINNVSCGFLNLSATGQVQMPIPGHLIRGNQLNHIRFNIPTAAQINEADDRLLGFALHSMTFVSNFALEKHPCPLDTPIDVKNNPYLYFGPGWSHAEDNLRWTQSNKVETYFRLSDRSSSSVQLIINTKWLNSAQKITYFVNGFKCDTIDVSEPNQQLTLTIPIHALYPNKLNRLIFDIPTAASPGGADTRLLGISVSSFKFINNPDASVSGNTNQGSD